MTARSSARARQTETVEPCARMISMISTTWLTRQLCIIVPMMSKSGSGSPLSWFPAQFTIALRRAAWIGSGANQDRTPRKL